MEENIEALKYSLLHNNPNLFVGAGFCLGGFAQNDEKIPSGNDLKKMIIKELLNFEENTSEYQELIRKPLYRLCSYTQNEIGKEKIYDYLQGIFQFTRPAQFHYSYTKYPWNKVFTTNIDDILENIYSDSKIPFLVQNRKRNSTRSGKNVVEIFKLHGCVNNMGEGIIFNEDEYLNSVLDKEDYKFGVLSVELQNKDFIFVGSDFDDFNIKYYLNLYASTSFTSARGKLFFVNPKPSLTFKSDIKQVDGILIEYTAEQFAAFLETINLTRESIDSVKLAYEGYIKLRTEKEKLTKLLKRKYDSELYIGAHPRWEDIFYEWDIPLKKVVNDFKKLQLQFEKDNNKTFILSLVGGACSCKSVLLKRLANNLLSDNYEVISFEGKLFNPNRFLNYIRSTSFDKYALVIDDGSYIYNQLQYLHASIDENIKLLIITSSRPFYHSKRKYSLAVSNFCEYFLNVELDSELAKCLIEKVNEKGYMGKLASLPDRKSQIDFISFNRDLATAMFKLTHGKDFKKRFEEDITQIIKEGNYRDALIKLAIFQKLDLPYFPKELFVNLYKKRAGGILKRLDDVIRNDKEKVRIELKNNYIAHTILKFVSKKEIINNLKELLIYLSPHVENVSSSYWNEIQSVLMRDKLIKTKLKLNSKELKYMLYELKNYYFDNYNYWLQLGIAEQLEKDYEKALNHFHQAESLGPNSYMVKNAIGKNYILQAIRENNIDLSKDLFAQGKQVLFDLINYKEEYQVRAYSIHSYLAGLLDFYENKKNLKISLSEINEAKNLLDKMLKQYSNDPMFTNILKRFLKFQIECNVGAVTMKLEELQEKYNSIKDEKYDDVWE